jgi:hypothetical protein
LVQHYHGWVLRVPTHAHPVGGNTLITT